LRDVSEAVDGAQDTAAGPCSGVRGQYALGVNDAAQLPPAPLPTKIVQIEGRPAVTVRYAVPGDAEQVAGLYVAGEKLAYSPYAPKRYIDLIAPDVAGWKEQIERPKDFVYAAEAEGKLIGFANGGLAEPGYGVLADTWVEAGWHRTGVSYVLAEQVIEHLRLAGATFVEAAVLLQNEYGDRFCKGLGLEYKGHRKILWLHGRWPLPDLMGEFGFWRKPLVDEAAVPAAAAQASEAAPQPAQTEEAARDPANGGLGESVRR
jgi:hypothetical protein